MLWTLKHTNTGTIYDNYNLDVSILCNIYLYKFMNTELSITIIKEMNNFPILISLT